MSAKADRLAVNSEIAKRRARAADCVRPCKMPTPIQALDVRVRDVFNANEPVKDAEVTVSGAGGGATVATGRTDADGDVVFKLSVGQYKVSARKDWHVDDPVEQDHIDLREYQFQRVDLKLEALRYYLYVDGDRDGTVDSDHEGLNRIKPWKWLETNRGAALLCNNDHDDGLAGLLRNPDHEDSRVGAGNDGSHDLAAFEIHRVGTTAAPPRAKNWRASLEVLAGKQDRIRIFPALAANTVAVIGPGTGASHRIDLHQGASSYPTTTFGMEATGYAQRGFDGLIQLKLTVSCDNAPAYFTGAEIRVAPWMMSHPGDDVRHVYVVDLGPDVLAGARLTGGNATFRTDLIAAVGATPVISHPNHDRWMQDCMEVGYSVLPRDAGGARRHRIDAVMQAYRDFGPGDLKTFPRTLLDADFGFHFPGRASRASAFSAAMRGAPGGSGARTAALRGMLQTIVRERKANHADYLTVVTLAEASSVDTELRLGNYPAALAKLRPTLRTAVNDAASAVEQALSNARSLDAAGDQPFLDARAAILARGFTVGTLANDLATKAYLEMHSVVSRTTTYDSNGNLECTPPCKAGGQEYPWGRIYYGPGAGAQKFDGETRDFLHAQIVQKPFELDTGWLEVGHVDEMVGFVPAAGARFKQFCILIASPKRAFQILDGAPAGAPVLQGRELPQDGRWTLMQTTAGVLRNGAAPTPVLSHAGTALTGKQLRKYNLDTLQKRIDKVVAKLKKETGATASMFIEVPVVFKPGEADLAEALTADMVNMLVVNGTCVIPKPYGPLDAGRDLFEVDLDTSLAAKAGLLTRHFVDDWYTYHAMMGEIHCGTNVQRHPANLNNWLASDAAEWWRFKN